MSVYSASSKVSMTADDLAARIRVLLDQGLLKSPVPADVEKAAAILTRALVRDPIVERGRFTDNHPIDRV